MSRRIMSRCVYPEVIVMCIRQYLKGSRRKGLEDSKERNRYLIDQVRASVDDERVLKAMETVDRKYFVIEKEAAYLDVPLDIGKGQTISQPSTVGIMLQLLELRHGNNVLEAGTGSGWNASLIAYMVYPGQVHSIEKEDHLVRQSVENVREAKKHVGRLENLTIEKGNVYAEKGIYDRIIFTAGITRDDERRIERFAQEHLHMGGVMVCPFQSGPMIVMRKTSKGLAKEYTKDQFSFVPLKRW